MIKYYRSGGVLLLMALLQLSIPTFRAVSSRGEGHIEANYINGPNVIGSCAQDADLGNLDNVQECTVTSSSTLEPSSTFLASEHPSDTSDEPFTQTQYPDGAELPTATVHSTTDYRLADIPDATTTATTNTTDSESSTNLTPPPSNQSPYLAVITQSNSTSTDELTPFLVPPPPAASSPLAPLPTNPSPPPPSPPDAATTPTPLSTTATADATAGADPVSDLRHLLAAARHAVAALESAIDQQETRMQGLPPGMATADPNPAISSAADALMAALGLDPYGSGGTAARTALRTAVNQVLAEQAPGQRGSGTPGVGVSGGVFSSPVGGAGGAVWTTSPSVPPWGEGSGASMRPKVPLADVREGVSANVGLDGVRDEDPTDWFRRHFSLRAAVTAPAAAAPAADGGGTDGGDTGCEGANVAPPMPITCAFPYELPHPDAAAIGGGALQYIVAGDAAGMLYLLSAVNGRTLTALPTGAASAVTACAAYYVRSWESVVVTGHADGTTCSFHVVLRRRQDGDGAVGGADEGGIGGGGSSVEEGQRSSRQQQQTAKAARLKKMKKNKHQTEEDGGGRHDMANVFVKSMVLRHLVASMPRGALPWAAVEELIAPAAAAPSPQVAAAAVTDPSVGEAVGAVGTAGLSDGGDVEMPYTGPPAPIMHILPFRLGHKAGGRRLVLVLDRAGNLRLERDNGTIRHWVRTNRTQLAVRFVANHVVMLSAHHATVLNTMQLRPPRAHACQHLNGSKLLAASFDGHRAFRGFGVTARGELVTLVTPHEGGLAVCKATRAFPLPWLAPALAPPPDGGLPRPPLPLSLTALRGYLVLSYGSNHMLFNVTGVTRLALPPLAAVSDEQIARVAAPAASPLPSSSPSSCAATGPSCPHQATGPLGGTLLPPAPMLAVGPGSQVLLMVLTPPPTPTTPPSPQTALPSRPYQQRQTTSRDEVEGQGMGVEDMAMGMPGGGGASGGATLLVVLESRLPRVPVLGEGSKTWSQPVFIAAMIFVGIYQFWRMSSVRANKRAVGGRSGRFSRRSLYGGYGGHGSGMYGDTAEYMYGGNKVPTQPRSALRRPRSDRPVGRSVTYEDEEDY